MKFFMLLLVFNSIGWQGKKPGWPVHSSFEEAPSFARDRGKSSQPREP
jgi:hypothetical protein